PDTAGINERYGGLMPNVTRVVFVNGLLDPWSSLSLPADPMAVLKATTQGQNAVITMPRASHVSDFYFAPAYTEFGVDIARRQILDAIVNFLGQERTFQTSASARKERDGKSDDNDDPDSSATKQKQEEDEQETDDKDDSKSASRRRRAPRRSESEKPAAAAGANGGEQAQADPLTQLKRAVGVADYAQGQQSFIPDNYPNVMMLPITRRPLFPSLYKSIQVQDPQVIGALKELVERGEPYLATFMLKNDERDVDSIGDMDEVHEIGVFSRIMSIYVSPNPEDKHLTVALYPWRRVRMKRIIGIEKDPESTAAPALDQQELIVSESTEDSAVEEVVSPVANAANVLKAIKLDYNFTALEVENVEDEPYDAKDPTISATMSEIVSVLREITTMNP
ncbi:ATP-dependent Lon protease pim1, partial [Coemansia sp. S142-1]